MAARAWRRIGLKQAAIAFSAALILAFAGILLQSSLRARQQILADAAARAESMASYAQSSTGRTLRSVDAMLAGISQSLATAYRDAPLGGPEVGAMLHRMNEHILPVRDILIVDPTGHEVNGGLLQLVARDFAGYGFVTAQEGTTQSGLFIGRPHHSSAGWSVFVSRRLALPGGFQGAIAAEVPVRAFAEGFAATVPGSGFRIALLAADGRLVASDPPDEAASGRPDPLASPVLAHLAAHRTGSFDLAGAGSREPGFITYRAIDGTPLVAAVSVDTERLLAGWRGEQRNYIALITLIAVTIGAFTWALVRLLDRRQQHLEELRRNEAKFVQQSALLQSTLEHMGEGLCVFDRSYRLLAWNDRFLSLLELPSSIGRGTRFEDILRLQASRGDFGEVDIETEIHARLERVRNEIAQTTERTTRAGRTLEIRRRRMPAGGFVTLYSDVTERHRFEEEIIEARNQAEIANRSKGEFLANMSHELRTPLNAIIGFSDILRNEKFGPVGNRKYLEYAGDIYVSGIHLLDLISDVLDMSKIEAGKLELYEEEVRIPELVSSCLSMVKERARERSVRIAADLGGHHAPLWADLRGMKQILLNLLSNAVKFSRDGSAVTITARLEGDRSTIITVSDSGIGMTPDQIARARQPFGQAHAATTRRYGGTGLGLPITQRLVELHGGTLRIDSRLGEGTTVTVLLPPSRTLAAIARTA